MVIAKIGASLRQHDVLPPIGTGTQRDRDALNNVDVLVGIDHGPDNNSRPGLTPDEHSGTHSSEVELQPMDTKGSFSTIERESYVARLGLGAEGAITSKSGSERLERT